MLNSLCHMFTLDDMLAHLTMVAAHLVPGGLYIAELAHPADYLAPVPRTSSEWTVEQGGLRAEVRWGGHQDRIDPVSQITAEHMSITAHGADGDHPHRQRRGAQPVLDGYRPYRAEPRATEIEAAVAGWPAAPPVAARYGDFDDSDHAATTSRPGA